MSARLESIARFIDIDREVGLEIGPLDRPVVTRQGGRRIYYADHQAPEALVERWRYEQPGGSAAGIDLVPLDYRIDSTDLSGPPEGHFDYLVASHVIEHLPDPIRWLQGARRLLKPGGHLWLAVPNRRFTFDVLRPFSTAGDWLQAYREKRTKPDSKAVFDSDRWTASLSQDDLDAIWLGRAAEVQARARQRLARTSPKPERLAQAAETYTDVHCTVVDEAEFLDILLDVARLDLLALTPVDLVPTTIGNIEFYCVLRNDRERTSLQQAEAIERLQGKILAARTHGFGDTATNLSRGKLFRLLMKSIRDKGFRF
ncbi:MAG: methyltransferase domain-containing protein [Azospirillaceae bacterium]